MAIWVACIALEAKNLFKSEHPAHENYEEVKKPIGWITSGLLVELFHFVKCAVRRLKQAFDGRAVFGIDRKSDADGSASGGGANCDIRRAASRLELIRQA